MGISCLRFAPQRLIDTADAGRVGIDCAAQPGDDALGPVVSRARAARGHDLARLLGVVDQHARHEQVVVEGLPAADLAEVGAVEGLGQRGLGDVVGGEVA